MEKFHGTGVALVTPFDESGGIDFEGLLKLIDHVSGNGADYFVVQGTTGESATTTFSEKIEILNFIQEHNPGNLPIVFGIGGNNTAQILDNIKSVNFNQIDAILSVSPYYNKPSQEGIIAHYTAIADLCPKPVIMYNVPGRTSSNMSSKTTLTLAKHENIIGIKEASGNLEQCMAIIKGKPDDFLLISGDDMLLVPILSVGGVGIISVLANAFPGIFAQAIAHCSSGDFHNGMEVISKLSALHPLMYREGNPVGIKYVLKLMEICEEYVRLPLISPSDGLKEEILSIFNQLEL